MKSWNLVLLSAAALSLLGATAAHSQPSPTFPSKVVTLVVPYTANSGSDIIARILGPRLQARWGQPVIIDNKPGASGNIGTGAVAKAAPDGHTLLMMIDSITMTPSFYKNVPFDLTVDFAPVAKLAQASFALAVNPSVPAKDMQSLMAYVKKSGGKVDFGSPGKGTTHHLGMELLKSRYALDMQHVPYKGIGSALTDLMGGQVQIMFASVHSVLPNVQAGKIRLLAVTGVARSPLVPDVPTFREQGIDVMDRGDAWYGVMAPAHTPPELVARLNRDFTAVLALDDVKVELAKLGLSIKTSSPEELGELVKSDLVRWRKVVRDANITAED